MEDEKAALAGQILDAIQGIELLVAELYRRFARFFPKDRELWERLSAEEEGHASAAAEIKSRLSTGRPPVIHSRINLVALGTYQKGLGSHIHRLERGEINRTKALFTALDIERTLVERSFYDLVGSDDPELSSVRDRVAQETRKHLERLEAYIAAAGAEPAGT